jgi:hypothetical protein
MRILLVNDSSRNPNWGCRATSLALRATLAEAGADITETIYLERLSRLEIRDRSSWRRWQQRLEPLLPKRPLLRELLGRAFERLSSRLSDVVPATVDGFDAAADAAVSGRILEDVTAALERSEAVVINAEGGIYDHQRKGRMMLFLAYLARTRFDLPTGVVNHTADLSDPRTRAMAERIYPLLDHITFREPRSQLACRPFVEAGVVPDAAFRYRPAPVAAWRSVAAAPDYYGVWPDHAVDFDPSQPYVCLGGSCLLLRPDRPLHDPLPGYRRLIEALQRRFGQVVLTASDRPDERLFRPLADAFGLPLVGIATPVQQAVDLLGHAAVYVGGRWHPTIFATSGGTPSVLLSADGLADMLDLSPTFDALDLEANADAVADAALARAEAGEPLRSRLLQLANDFALRTPEHAGLVARLGAGRPA